MTARWIDAHCHLADRRLDADRDALLERSRAAGVGTWIQGGYDPEDWARQAALAQSVGDGFVCAFGLHPWFALEAPDVRLDAALRRLEEMLPAVGLLGETGLDRFRLRKLPEARRAEADRRQRRAFQAQLALAYGKRYPLVLHVVRAHADVLAKLESLGPPPAGGMVHSFSGSADDARRYLALGLHLSFGTGALRAGREPLLAIAATVPPERRLLETDAPDQAAEPLAPDGSATLNEPAKLLSVARALAPLVGASAERVLDDAADAARALLAKRHQPENR
jgi:TatD DNase family protein